jgi:hypothetical protein
MREQFRNASAELYFVLSAVVSVVIAFVATRFRLTAFGSFVHMAAILVSADVMVYVLTRAGLLKVPRGRVG